MKLAHEDKGFSPVGLKVLVVDDDPICLRLLERMLRECKYDVITCTRAAKALSILRDNKGSLDLVISDVHMPDMDGFKLLELIGLEMDLPVIMMSANGETDAVMKGVLYGACDYLVKPVRIEELRNIWQHVVRKRQELGHISDDASSEEWDKSEANVDNSASKKRRKTYTEPCDIGESSIRNISNMRKSRVVWSFELHQQFVKAINSIGIDKAVPKRILEVMNVRGLTRENVASHLQKYRLYLKRLSGVTPEPFPIASFQAYEGCVLGGTMKVQKAVPTSRCSTSIFHRGLSQFDAGTLASLNQLQAAQQAAHEKGQILDSTLVSSAPLQNIPVDDKKEQNKQLFHQCPEFFSLDRFDCDELAAPDVFSFFGTVFPYHNQQ